MNRRGHKCKSCKQTYTPSKVDQKFCSHRCRQADYRRRKAKAATRKKATGERFLVPATCLYCRGTFWAKTRRACYCSTSCRTLSHRTMKAGIPAALAHIYTIPDEKAADLLETQSVARIKELLFSAGLRYSPTERVWYRSA